MKLASIQMLRGIAALLVAVYHIRAIEKLAIGDIGLTLPDGTVEAAMVGGFWENGFSGVDLFFVISGFIMVYVTGTGDRGPKPTASFLFARATRIYPLWWLFATVMVVYFLFAYGVPLDLERAMQRDQSPAEHLISSYLLLPQPNWPVLGVGWTLVHEMYFYIAFAISLLFARKYLPVFLLVWAIAVIVGSTGGLSAPFASDWVKLVFYPMTMEFILGAFAALLVTSGRRWRPGLVTLAAVIWLCAMLQFALPPEKGGADWPPFVLQWGRVLMFGLPCALLIYGLASLEAEGRFREFKPLTWLGDWSYALYLSHMIVFSALRRIFPIAADLAEQRLGLPTEYANLLRPGAPGPWDNIIFIATCLIAGIVFSSIVYRLFEVPLIRLFSRMRKAWFDGSNQALRPAPVQARIW